MSVHILRELGEIKLCAEEARVIMREKEEDWEFGEI